MSVHVALVPCQPREHLRMLLWSIDELKFHVRGWAMRHWYNNARFALDGVRPSQFQVNTSQPTVWPSLPHIRPSGTQVSPKSSQVSPETWQVSPKSRQVSHKTSQVSPKPIQVSPESASVWPTRGRVWTTYVHKAAEPFKIVVVVFGSVGVLPDPPGDPLG